MRYPPLSYSGSCSPGLNAGRAGGYQTCHQTCGYGYTSGICEIESGKGRHSTGPTGPGLNSVLRRSRSGYWPGSQSLRSRV